jgi:hypothetical protein
LFVRLEPTYETAEIRFDPLGSGTPLRLCVPRSSATKRRATWRCTRVVTSTAPGSASYRVVADLPNAERGFTLIFAATPFPGHQYRLDWLRADGDGNWYRSADLDMEGWLRPALFRYFDEAPKHLYAQVKPLPRRGGAGCGGDWY